MSISYIYNGEPMVGTAADDFFIAYKGSTGTDNNTVNAAGGDDLVVGDSSDTFIPQASYLNGSIATAFNLESITSPWTTGENQMFFDGALPHATVIAEATIGQSEFFRVAIGAGQQITIDIDFASNTAIGSNRDLVVELQDSLGNVIATADDSLVTQGGQGSFPSSPGSASSYDPFLSFTVPTGGIYYINVRPFGGGPGSTFTENNTFVLNVTVTGHAVNATNPVQGADTINGGEGNDVLFGQGGGDTINGDGGDDFIDSGSAGDIVHGGEGNDTLYGGDGTEENIHGDNGNDRLISGGEGHYYGDAGNDVIFAGLTAGVNEILDGGADVDTIDTTTWNGAYEVNLATGATNFGESFTNFENVVTGNGADIIIGTGGANDITTRGGTDTVDAGAGNDIVAGGADGDTLDGGLDSDILNYRASSGAVTINLITNSVSGGHAAGDTISNFEGVWGSVLGDTLTADAGNNELRGFEGNDTLSGGVGNDILDGGINDDTMTGGTGDDTYYLDSLGDVVNELPGEGIDTLAVAFDYALSDSSALEWLATIDPAKTTPINLTGNSGANSITGNAGANILDGKGGVDTLAGLGGDDWYYVDNAADVVNEGAGDGTLDRIFSSVSYALAAGTQVERLSTVDNAGTTAINLTGNGIDNVIYGNAGANVLDGKGGVDILIGLAGDDWYYVDNALDSVNEAVGGGTLDRIFSSVSYTLGATTDVERLSTTDNAGTAAINLTGNGIDNVIYGNAGANILDGKGGVDILIGLGGDDWYYVDNAADSINEVAGGGTLDRIFSSVSYTLGSSTDVERLSTTDNAGTAAINLTGNGIDNVMYGNAGANILDGRGGVDILIGLGGDDWYYVDNAADSINEVAGGGTLDRIFSSVSYTLGSSTDVERLSTTDNAGTAAINLTGNGIDNVMYGNAGANILDGRGGVDILIGLGGDDWYYVDNALDSINEVAGGGTLDRIFSSVSYTLAGGTQVERLSTTDNAGTAAINLTGNEIDNVMYGNAGANVLDGRGGVDILIGLGGDDWYFIDNAADAVNEGAGGGINDRILSSVSYALGAGVQVEILSTTDNLGMAALNFSGNELANSIFGNSGINILDGKGGSDALNGFAGADTFRFTTALGAGNVDAIGGYSVADDAIQLDDAVFAGLATGALAAGAFVTGAAAADADDRIIYNSATGALLFDADGVGGAAAVQFATLSTGLAMAASEFFVF